MRTVALSIFALSIVAACSPAHPVAPATQKSEPPRCMTIVGWNDLHGQLEADDPIVDTGRIPAGGVVALADAVDKEQRAGDPTFLLDAGDLFTGPMESTLAEGKPVIAAYAALGVDAAAIGNHEFDFGPVGYDKVTAAPNATDANGAEGPRGALFARMNEATFPFVSANLHYANGKELAWPHTQPAVIIERGGFKLGVVGYSTEETPKTTLKPNVSDLEFSRDAAARVAASIRALRAKGASPVVLLAHASLEGDLPQSLDEGPDPHGNKRFGEIARLLDAMPDAKPDLVIAGHRHAWLLGRVRDVPIVSTSQHGVGYARIRFCQEGTTTKLASIDRRVAFASDPPLTPLGHKVRAAIEPFLSAVRAQAATPVATLPRACGAQAPNGTAFAEMIARALVVNADAAKAPPGLPRVGVMNAGGLRAPLHAGTLPFRDLFAALPFENAIATCTTTRAGLVKALGNLGSKVSARDRFPFGIYGAKVRASRYPGGVKIVDVTLDAEKSGRLADDAPVTIVLPDFLLWGGDGFLDGVSCTSSSTSQLRLRDAFRMLVSKEQGGCDGAPKDIEVEGP